MMRLFGQVSFTKYTYFVFVQLYAAFTLIENNRYPPLVVKSFVKYSVSKFVHQMTTKGSNILIYR